MKDSNLWYFDKYGKMPPFRGPDDLERAFWFGANKHKLPLVTRKPLEVLPRVWSQDPRFIRFLLKLSDRLSAEIPVGVDEKTGYCYNGVHAGFESTKTVAGHMMNPMSAVLQFNHRYRTEELGLEAKYDVVGKLIARNVWRLVFSHYKPSNLKVSQHSSGGAPRFTSDVDWKLDFAHWLLEEDNFHTMLKLVKAKDWIGLANEFEMLWMLYSQKRDQVDSVGKPRFVFDKEYAETEGLSGWGGNADKTVDLQGLTDDENAQLSSTRARNVQAAVWTVNCVCSIVSTGTMQAMFERFPSLFHTNTAAEIKAAVDGHEVYASDVKEYDRSMSEDALSMCFEVAREFWSDELVDVAERLMFACYYSRPLGMEGGMGFWIGQLFGDGRQVVAGNRSGHNWTSLVAKVNKVIDELIALHRLGIQTLGNELAFMRGEGIVKLVNNGDDNLTYGPKKIIDAYAAFRDDPVTGKASGHYLVTREIGCVFSGQVLMRPNLETPAYTPVPRLATGIQKIYCPERSIGGHFRKYWHIGIQDRMRNADSHPFGRQMWAIHNEVFAEMMEPHFGSFSGMLMSAASRNPLDLSSDNPNDRLVLEDPDLLQWRFKDGDVSAHVEAVVVKKIEYARFEHIIKTHFKGTLV